MRRSLEALAVLAIAALLTIFLALCIAPRAFAAPTWVTSVAVLDTTDNTTNLQTSPNISVSVGDLVVVHSCSHNANSTNYTLSDSQSNTISVVGSTAFQGTIIAGRAWTTKIGTATSGYNVTANKSGSSMGIMLTVIVISGWDGTTAVDGAFTSANGTGTNSAVTPGASSLSTDLELSTVCGGDDSTHGFAFGTANTGMTTEPTWTLNTATGRFQSQTMYKNSTGSVAAGYPSMTNGSSRDWVSYAWTVKDASSGGGGPPVNLMPTYPW